MDKYIASIGTIERVSAVWRGLSPCCVSLGSYRGRHLLHGIAAPLIATTDVSLS